MPPLRVLLVARPVPVQSCSRTPWTACACSTRPRRIHLSVSHPVSLARRGLATDERTVSLQFHHGAYGIPKRVPLNSPLPAAARPEGRTGGALGSVLGWFHPPSPAPDPEPDRTNSSDSDLSFPPDTTPSEPLTPPVPPIPRDHVAPYALPVSASGAPVRDAQTGQIFPDHLRSVQVGEDAFFLRPDAMGVADGVGGWTARPGANAALFSRLLMHFASVELSRNALGSGATTPRASRLSVVPTTPGTDDAWALSDPVEVVRTAWRRSVRVFMEEGLLGSCTALVAVLKEQEMRIANVGDCVLLVVRDGDILFRSTEQQHSFNFPLQLGMMGDTAEAARLRLREKAKMASIAARLRRNAQAAFDQGDNEQAATLRAQADALDPAQHNPLAHEDLNAPLPLAQIQEHGSYGEDDLPPLPADPEWDEPRRDAGRWTIAVMPGDIVILGSDGLLDNLFDDDILEEVLRFIPPSTPDNSPYPVSVPDDFRPQAVAEALCRRAKFVAESARTITSPFQERAMEEGLNYVGGKNDDISVLVSVIQPSPYALPEKAKPERAGSDSDSALAPPRPEAAAPRP